MQIFTWNKAGFEQMYWRQYYKQRGCGQARAHNCRCSEVDISYSRLFFEGDNLFKERAQKIVARLNLNAGMDVFVIGCGLGFLMEELRALGINVYGCDNSAYIHSIKHKEKSSVTILNISATSNTFTSDVQKATGALWFDAVITEDVLTSHDEFNTILTNCESIVNTSIGNQNIVHIVAANANSPFTSKTMSQWREVNPTHTWLDINGD